MASKKKWAALSTNEKIETLHEEIKSTESNTRSLKRLMTDLVSRVGEVRRYLGMHRAT